MLLNCGVGEDSWESLGLQEIHPVHPKWNPSWIFIGRPDAEAETPILSPPDVKSWLIWKDPDAGKDWRKEEKGTTEDEIVERHHQLDGCEFGWTPGIGDEQGGLACCNSWSIAIAMTRRTIALTRQTFVGKVMSLLFNMLSRLLITFLPRSKRLLISWLQSPSAVILDSKHWTRLSNWTELTCTLRFSCKFNL